MECYVWGNWTIERHFWQSLNPGHKGVHYTKSTEGNYTEFTHLKIQQSLGTFMSSPYMPWAYHTYNSFRLSRTIINLVTCFSNSRTDNLYFEKIAIFTKSNQKCDLIPFPG